MVKYNFQFIFFFYKIIYYYILLYTNGKYNKITLYFNYKKSKK